MKRSLVTGLCAALALAVGAGALHAGEAKELKVGDEAPDFELQGSDGKTYKLSDFEGKQAVIIAWFPKAFTGGCTKECISMRKNGKALRQYDVVFFTASVDTPEVNTKFAKSLMLDYPILSDPGKQTAKAYGVVTAKRKLPYRWTYIIGKDGKILDIEKKVKVSSHGADNAAKLEKLGIDKKDS